MGPGPATDDAPVDRVPRAGEPIGRWTPYGSTLADLVAIMQLVQQAWVGALMLAAGAGALALAHLVRYRHRPLGRSGLGVVLITAISCALVGVSVTMLVDEAPPAPSNASAPTTTGTVAAAPPAASSPSPPLTPAAPTSTGAAGPVQPYVDKPLDVPKPDNSVEIDFDKPVVSSSSLPTGTDLEYDIYSGLRPANRVQVGTGPAERPGDPAVCVDSAQTRPINDPTDAETIEIGMAFCVITDKGNVIWFTVTGKSRDKYSPGFTFRATMWSRRP